MKRVLLALLISLAGFLINADEEKEDLKKGVELYEQGNLAEALNAFLNAEKTNPENLLAKYNALAVMAKQGRLDDMERKLTKDFSDLGSSPEIRAKSTYNLGTAYLETVNKADMNNQLASKAKELDSAIRWLQQSLTDFPQDAEAKNNLEYANKLKEKLEKQQKENQDNKDNDEKKQDNKDQQNQNKDQKKEDQKQSEQEQKDQKQQQNQPREKQPQEHKEREISDATARNLLQAAKDAEKKAMKMLREQQQKNQKKKRTRGKDW